MPARKIVLLAAIGALHCTVSALGDEGSGQTNGADALIGIWASETTFEQPLRGELDVERHGSDWSARIAGHEAHFEVTAQQVRFRFADGLGEFRGTQTPDGGAINGFWIQPPDVKTDEGDPGDLSQPFATPIVLEGSGTGTWSGTVRPLADRFSLYLRIFRNEDGELVAAFRNPEFNANGGASLFKVTRDGGQVLFSIEFDDDRKIEHEATLVNSPEQLRLYWPWAERNLELLRVGAKDVPDFFPRPPGEPPYTYKAPPETGDGWPTASASEVGLDEASLTAAIRGIIDGDPAARRPNLIHSFLIARHGRLVLEEYFYGYDRERPHDVRSAGKAFASVMLGALMMSGQKIGPDTRVYQLLDAQGPFANPDPRKSDITLAQLMTHTSGLDCDDANEESLGNEGTMQTQTGEPNWWRYTLDLPVVHDPGERYAYCSAGMNLVGDALTHVSGTWLPALLDRLVARPLGFDRYYWNLMPTEEGYLGGGARLRPRDLLRLGQAYLDGGVWQGRRIVAQDWVQRSTTAHIKISPTTTGIPEQSFSEFYVRGEDGYAWHLPGLRAGDKTYRSFAATGNGGQILIVIPELDMVAVFTGGNYGQGSIWLRWPDEILGSQIVTAMKD